MDISAFRDKQFTLLRFIKCIFNYYTIFTFTHVFIHFNVTQTHLRIKYLIVLIIMDVDLLRPGMIPIAPNTKLWFEFLIEPSLLEEHLNNSHAGIHMN